MQYEQKFRDIATLVAARCVNTQTGWPFTMQTIETAMKDTIHFAINPTRPAKQQALEVIERLKEHMPIARARMHLKISAPKEEMLTSQAVASVAGDGCEILSSTDSSVELLADPSKFRDLEKLARKFEGSVSILEFSSHNDQESDLGQVQRTAPVSVVTEAPGESDAAKAQQKPVVFSSSVSRPTDATAMTKLQCLSCGIDLADRNEQRSHYVCFFCVFVFGVARVEKLIFVVVGQLRKRIFTRTMLNSRQPVCPMSQPRSLKR